MGQAGLEDFCGVMNLVPPVNKNTFKNTMKRIEKVSQEETDGVMNEETKRLKRGAKGENLEVKKLAVTVDETCQKRGFSSKNGAIFATSVETERVLSYKVLSVVYYDCCSKPALKQGSGVREWWESYKSNCTINHDHQVGIWRQKVPVVFFRSVEKRGLVCSIMVGDGEIVCNAAVVNALKKKYEDTQVMKEECVGHIQKRIGTSLREYKIMMHGK